MQRLHAHVERAYVALLLLLPPPPTTLTPHLAPKPIPTLNPMPPPPTILIPHPHPSLISATTLAMLPPPERMHQHSHGLGAALVAE